MEKISKKVLSVILSVLLVATMIPIGIMTASAADDLTDAKNSFTDKVNEMKESSGDSRVVYTNLSAAYTAYVEACSVKESDSDASAEAAKNLNDAVSKMKKMTISDLISENSGNEKVFVNGTDAAGYYSNVLYAENPANLQYSQLAHGHISSSIYGLNYDDDWFIYQPSAVLVYTGKSDAKIPVLFAEQEKEGKNCFRFHYVSESGGRLSGYWYGYDTAKRNDTSNDVNVVFPTTTTSSVPKESVKNDNYDNGYEYWDAQAVHGDTSDFYNFKNSLAFTLKDNELQKSFPSFEWNIDASWRNLLTSNQHLANGETRLNTSNDVTVINYKMLTDALESRLAVWSDANSLLDTSTDEFASGTSAAAFAAIDKASAFDLTDKTVFSFRDRKTTIDSAVGQIQSIINTLNSATGSAASATTLKAYIEKYEKNMKENPFRSDLQKTYDLYIKAKEYYDAYIFGDKNKIDSTAMTKLASDFQTAVDNQKVFAAYDESTGKYVANAYTGEFVPGSTTNTEGQTVVKKFFTGDDIGGEPAYKQYKKYGAASNLLYFPEVTESISDITLDGSSLKLQFLYPKDIVLVYDSENVTRFPVFLRAGDLDDNSVAGNKNDWLRWVYPTDHEAVKLDRSGGEYIWPLPDKRGKFADLKNHLYDDSAIFGIRQETVYLNQTDRTNNTKGLAYGWQGGSKKDSGDVDVNWFKAWDQDSKTYTDNIGDLAGSKTVNVTAGGTPADDSIGRIKAQEKTGASYTLGAASAIQYKNGGNDFANADASNMETLYKHYGGMNWDLAWNDQSGTGYWPCGGVVAVPSNIDIIDTKPVSDAVEDLLNGENGSKIKDILQYVYLYDRDAKDYKTLLAKIDAVGDFNPNDYDYSKTATGTEKLQNSDNQGVYDCVKRIKEIIAQLNTVNESIGDSTDSNKEDDGKVTPPSDDDKDKNKSSDSTEDNTTERNEGDNWYDWYNDLRNSLMNPLKKDDCSSGSAWTRYTNALNVAKSAITAIANNGANSADYPASFSYKFDADGGVEEKKPTDSDATTKTISEIAKELKDAKAEYLKSGGFHTYIYESEDADQKATFECESNVNHPEATADMSAYNELDIAYNTIDPEAYGSVDNFKKNVALYYGTTETLGSDSNKKPSGTDTKAYNESALEEEHDKTHDDKILNYDNLRFVQVKPHKGLESKVQPALKKDDTTPNNEVAVQNYVDSATANLLEAINKAQGDATTNQNSGVVTHKNLTKYRVAFAVVYTNPYGQQVKVDSNETTDGGSAVSTYIQNHLAGNNAGLQDALNSGEQRDYGSFPSFDATIASEVQNGSAEVYKWSITTKDGKERPFSLARDQFNCIIQQDCIITAYARLKSETNKTLITTYNPNGRLIEKVNVPDDSTIRFTLSDGTLTAAVDGKEYKISSTTSYDVTGVKVNGKNVDLDKDYTVSDLLKAVGGTQLDIKSAYTKKSTKGYVIKAVGEGGSVVIDKHINADGSLGVNVPIEDAGGTAEYDEKVKVEYSTKEKTFTSGSDTLKGQLYGIAINESELTGSLSPRYVAIAYNTTTTTDANGKSVVTTDLADSVHYYFRVNCPITFYPIYQVTTSDAGTHRYIVDDGTADGYTISNATDRYYLNRHLPFVISYMDSQYATTFEDKNLNIQNIPGKMVYRVAFTAGLPSNVKVTEHGWTLFRLHTDDSATYSAALSAINAPSSDEITVENAGHTYDTPLSSGETVTGTIYKQASRIPYNRESNQYSFSMKDSANTAIFARGYIKYTYTFENKGASAPIEAVSYGNADGYSNPGETIAQ